MAALFTDSEESVQDVEESRSSFIAGDSLPAEAMTCLISAEETNNNGSSMTATLIDRIMLEEAERLYADMDQMLNHSIGSSLRETPKKTTLYNVAHPEKKMKMSPDTSTPPSPDADAASPSSVSSRTRKTPKVSVRPHSSASSSSAPPVVVDIEISSPQWTCGRCGHNETNNTEMFRIELEQPDSSMQCIIL